MAWAMAHVSGPVAHDVYTTSSLAYQWQTLLVDHCSHAHQYRNLYTVLQVVHWHIRSLVHIQHVGSMFHCHINTDITN